ncbi:hypothetical protein [Waddlia chondrophila]|uniref:Putative membrane protein n=1 Tax=Waddlia chondrophila (strain ATCC VR-1470 / WSU 86-1044) TaxID=716544 RepID=D6YUX6_WADCW|nr:hypothetical protein [Waddlia chondrophila]ADI37937.1 putative membrane protein [Waddlia chondrophila WSU 86-1044]
MQLSEKDFIHETKSSEGWKVWLGLGIVALAFILLVFSSKWMLDQTHQKINKSPFLQVTNREFSLFLWQNPEFMRSNRKKKTGYLSGFHSYPKASPIPEQADEWVSAPPDVLFLYHTWKRLLSSDRFSRSVSIVEFHEFLDDAKEWQPIYWKGASPEYTQLVSRLLQLDQIDIRDQLPEPVLQAFIGWKNYYKEGKKINDSAYTSAYVASFLKKHPAYASNYWRPMYPDYLRSLDPSSRETIPSSEIPSFLKAALYNSKDPSEKIPD